MRTLNSLFVGIDMLCTKHCVEKIKTVGDQYMCASIPCFVPQCTYLECADAIITVGCAMLRQVSRLKACLGRGCPLLGV